MPVPAAQPPKSMVYVVEFYDYEANLFTPTIRVGLDGAWVGANHGHSYVAFPVSPGEHHICANWQSHLSRLRHLVSLAKLDAEPGKVYYFRARIIAQGEREPTLLDLTRIDSDEGKLLVASTRLSVSRPKE